MTTLNAASLTNLLSATLTATEAENLIDAAINRIAAHGYTMSLLSGTAGTKTKSVTQAQLGWIQAVASALYPVWKNSGSQSESYNMGAISESSSTSSSTGLNSNNAEQLAMQAAFNLSRTDWTRAII